VSYYWTKTSPSLLKRLCFLFPGMIHVRDVGLTRASMKVIWTLRRMARLHNRYHRRRFCDWSRGGDAAEGDPHEECEFPAAHDRGVFGDAVRSELKGDQGAAFWVYVPLKQEKHFRITLIGKLVKQIGW